MPEISNEILQQILAPISDENPCGLSKEDILATESDATVAIVELGMVHSDAAKNYREGRSADWQTVFDKATEVLTSYCKHSQFLVPWIESVPHLYGFEGITKAMNLATELLEKYPLEFHPVLEDRPIRKLEILSKLADARYFIEAISRIPFPKNNPNDRTVSYMHTKYAQAYEKAPESDRSEYIQQGYLSWDELELEFEKISAENCDLLVELLQGAIDASVRLNTILESSATRLLEQGFKNDELVGFSPVRRHLEAMLQFAKETLPNAKKVEPTTDQGESAEVPPCGNESVDRATGGFSTGTIQGSLQSRKAALKSLETLAEFFRKTEPHSPISYALQQAIRWADLPLPELLNELVPDSAKEEVLRRVGVRSVSE